MNIKSQIKNLLLTGGRAPATLDLARKFNSYGITVYVAESLPNHLCTYSRAVKESFELPAPKLDPERYIEELKAIIVHKKIDLVIPTCEEVFYIARYKEILTLAFPGVTIFVDSFEKLKMLHNKSAFIEYIRNLGKAVPRTWLLRSSEDVANFYTRTQFSQRIIIKAAFSRFATKIFELENGKNIPLLDVSVERPWVVQEFITGKQYCSYSICHSGTVFAHTAYAATFTAARGGCICFEHTDHPEIYRWVQDVVKDLKFTGQIAFDFIQTTDGILYPLECNPRATSGIHLLNSQEIVEAMMIPAAPVQISGSKSKMVALPMILYGVRQCKGFTSLKDWLKIFWQANDVLFSVDDPVPFFQQFVMLKTLYFIGCNGGISMLEATTYDIEWNGEDI